jgi:hypothetical protein
MIDNFQLRYNSIAITSTHELILEALYRNNKPREISKPYNFDTSILANEKDDANLL